MPRTENGKLSPSPNPPPPPGTVHLADWIPFLPYDCREKPHPRSTPEEHPSVPHLPAQTDSLPVIISPSAEEDSRTDESTGYVKNDAYIIPLIEVKPDPLTEVLAQLEVSQYLPNADYVAPLPLVQTEPLLDIESESQKVDYIPNSGYVAPVPLIHTDPLEDVETQDQSSNYIPNPGYVAPLPVVHTDPLTDVESQSQNIDYLPNPDYVAPIPVISTEPLVEVEQEIQALDYIPNAGYVAPLPLIATEPLTDFEMEQHKIDYAPNPAFVPSLPLVTVEPLDALEAYDHAIDYAPNPNYVPPVPLLPLEPQTDLAIEEDKIDSVPNPEYSAPTWPVLPLEENSQVEQGSFFTPKDFDPNSSNPNYPGLDFNDNDPIAPAIPDPDLATLEEIPYNSASNGKGLAALYLPKGILFQGLVSGVLPSVSREFKCRRVHTATFSSQSFNLNIPRRVTRTLFQLQNGDIELVPSAPGQITLVLKDEYIQGRMWAHSEKRSKVVSSENEMERRDFRAELAVKVEQIRLDVRVLSTVQGVPQVWITPTKGQLNLDKDVFTDLSREDISLEVIDTLRSQWKDLAVRDFQDTILPNFCMHMNEVVNSLLKSTFTHKTELSTSFSLFINTEARAFSISNHAIRLIFNGDVFNSKFKDRIPADCPTPQEVPLPILEDLSQDLQEDRIYLQMGDDVLQRAFRVWLYNDLRYYQELQNRKVLKGIELERHPHFFSELKLMKADSSQGPEIKELTLGVQMDFAISVEQKLIPDVSMGVRLRFTVGNFYLAGQTFDCRTKLRYRASNFDVIEVYNKEMVKVSFQAGDLMGIVNRIKEATQGLTIDDEVLLPPMKFGDLCRVDFERIFCLENTLLARARLEVRNNS
jgi:hypothetical protein